MTTKLNRRNLLRGAGIAAGTGIALTGGGYGLTRLQQANAQVKAVPAATNQIVPFYGTYQAGIITPAQEHLHFAAFDLLTENAAEVKALLEIWTSAAVSMSKGQSIGTGATDPHAPPADTGEALGHPANNLTLTVGFGPTLFVKNGKDRFGLAKQRPAALIDLPPLPGEALDATISGGDLCVQACSDDPQVAFHAIRNFTRLGRGLATLRWAQMGFSRTSTTSTGQGTPRNLMGFKDGTANIKAEDTKTLNDHVWVQPATGPAWMVGGSYMVTRRINIVIESWDRDFLQDQEQTIGRHKVSGAPLGSTEEFDAVNLTAKDRNGDLLIPEKSHVRLARGDGSIKILRRGYSFTDGISAQTGQLDAGLFFIGFQNDPRTHFVPLQQRLGQMDALNEYIVHTGSGIFAIPGGMADGEFFGHKLFNL